MSIDKAIGFSIAAMVVCAGIALIIANIVWVIMSLAHVFNENIERDKRDAAHKARKEGYDEGYATAEHLYGKR